MHHRTVRRGAAALALATALSFSGVRPAAAGEPGGARASWSWLARFLSGDRTTTTASLVDTFGAWLHQVTGAITVGTDKGLGIDPNGSRLDVNNPDPNGDLPGGRP
jgi:hypothetical protein